MDKKYLDYHKCMLRAVEHVCEEHIKSSDGGREGRSGGGKSGTEKKKGKKGEKSRKGNTMKKGAFPFPSLPWGRRGSFGRGPSPGTRFQGAGAREGEEEEEVDEARFSVAVSSASLPSPVSSSSQEEGGRRGRKFSLLRAFGLGRRNRALPLVGSEAGEQHLFHAQRVDEEGGARSKSKKRDFNRPSFDGCGDADTLVNYILKEQKEREGGGREEGEEEGEEAGDLEEEEEDEFISGLIQRAIEEKAAELVSAEEIAREFTDQLTL